MAWKDKLSPVWNEACVGTCGTNELNNLSLGPRSRGPARVFTRVLCMAVPLEGGSLRVWRWITSGNTLLYKSTQQRLPSGLSLIRPMLSWRRQADQPIIRAMPSSESERRISSIRAIWVNQDAIWNDADDITGKDEELSTEGWKCTSTLGQLDIYCISEGGIGVDAAAAGNISTFGRVDYDLNTDIKGFDCHFVEREPGQRHRGIDADRPGATWDIEDQSGANFGMGQ